MGTPQLIYSCMCKKQPVSRPRPTTDTSSHVTSLASIILLFPEKSKHTGEERPIPTRQVGVALRPLKLYSKPSTRRCFPVAKMITIGTTTTPRDKTMICAVAAALPLNSSNSRNGRVLSGLCQQGEPKVSHVPGDCGGTMDVCAARSPRSETAPTMWLLRSISPSPKPISGSRLRALRSRCAAQIR